MVAGGFPLDPSVALEFQAETMQRAISHCPRRDYIIAPNGKTFPIVLNVSSADLRWGMKKKGSLSPVLWMTSAFIVTANFTMLAQNNLQKKPPSAGAQAILDSLNSERSSMVTEDGSVDPQEAEHVQRMLRLYELRSGFTDVEQAKEDLGLTTRQESAETAQSSQPSPGDVQQLQSEVADLRQQLQQMQQANQSPQSPQGNGRFMNEPAGAPNDPTRYPQYNSTPRFYRQPFYR